MTLGALLLSHVPLEEGEGRGEEGDREERGRRRGEEGRTRGESEEERKRGRRRGGRE